MPFIPKNNRSHLQILNLKVRLLFANLRKDLKQNIYIYPTNDYDKHGIVIF